mgnify:CR=1 FL=1
MKTLTTLIAILSIAMIYAPVTAQDYDEGLAAYNAGDYASALKVFNLLVAVDDVNAKFVRGDIGSHFVENQCSMAERSYVVSSAVITGS